MRLRAEVEERGLSMTDIKEQVGETAGRIWEPLSSEGPQTLAQLKKRLNGTSELVHFAVGWLAREDKIELAHEKKGLRIQLK
jgi:hypothetical protein